ncbi:hypothetical protein [uncultured Tenacibaculum sp.]|uniref:hypothetical protein n=1 Tax=uncultured Tenacibaculum sp. TaxID=174713 RepID=UPI00262F2262|nr:hypothetical protein [uncultured Tenacibaculum sp.]
MKNKLYFLIIVFLLLIGLVSCNQSNELKEVQILFKPSFLFSTKFTVDVKEGLIKQYTYQDKYSNREWVDSVSYKVNVKDTLIIHYKRSFHVDSIVLNKFLNELKASRLDSTARHRASILDGIHYKFSKVYASKDTISLTSNLIRRNEKSQLEYKLLDAFFELAYKSINDYEGISGLENIQDYFYYGLPIRKVGDNPFEYRVWGTISGCREDNEDFIKFLNSLPLDKPVIFDLRNGSIAYCLSEVLEEFSKKRLLFFYGDKDAIKSKRIIEEIEIAEKNGEVLSELRKQAYETHKEIYEYWKKNKKINSYLTKKELLRFIIDK